MTVSQIVKRKTCSAPHTICQEAKGKIKALTVVCRDLYKKNKQLEESRVKEEKDR